MAADQNLSVLLMALSRIPPAEFHRLVFAIADGAARLPAHTRDGEARTRQEGLLGVYRLLHDDELWRALTPLI